MAGKSWLGRLRAGLSRSATRLSDGISHIFTHRAVDGATLEELEELLITADLGPETSSRLVGDLQNRRFGPDAGADDICQALAEDIAAILEPVAKPLNIDTAQRPFVIVVVGVNGSGKTTTIAKLAQQYRNDGKRVMMAAADTFRAAAIDQLRIWAERSGATLFAREDAKDAAGVAFDALAAARHDNIDILFVDTAGRLQNKADLMAELAKINRALAKLEPAAPHASILVLDATTGQNAHAQLDAFKKITDITGLVVTKLDGTARGGVLVALAEKYALPVHAIGVGEGIDDLSPFQAEDFARALLGRGD
ncbi:MAG: signal recognition particle-docking protein FtsY [Alphaproteobacteria bacterium]